jgi:hypothetical protein
MYRQYNYSMNDGILSCFTINFYVEKGKKGKRKKGVSTQHNIFKYLNMRKVNTESFKKN